MIKVKATKQLLYFLFYTPIRFPYLHPMSNFIIETERIALRRFVIEDYQEVFAYNSNPEVQKYTGDELVASPERAKELIQSISLRDYELYGYGRWAVVHKADNNRVIGFAGLKYLPEIDETDIGFRLLPEYWGQGIASEASIEIIKYGFEVLKLDNIIGIAMPENEGSWRILEKIGMSFYKMDGYLDEGGNYKWYKIEKEEYFKQS